MLLGCEGSFWAQPPVIYIKKVSLNNTRKGKYNRVCVSASTWGWLSVHFKAAKWLACGISHERVPYSISPLLEQNTQHCKLKKERFIWLLVSEPLAHSWLAPWHKSHGRGPQQTENGRVMPSKLKSPVT